MHFQENQFSMQYPQHIQSWSFKHDWRHAKDEDYQDLIKDLEEGKLQEKFSLDEGFLMHDK